LILFFRDSIEQASGLGESGIIFLAIFSATISMWVFSLLDDYIPGLFAVLAILVTGLVPAPVILSGFASDGFMMAMSTLALSVVVVSSGLSYRGMLLLLQRLPNGQVWQNLGIFLAGAILTPIIPTANGRTALVGPFLSDMVDSLRLATQGMAATRLAVMCFGGVSLLSATVMTSKSVNFVVFGLLPPQDQDHFQWLTWVFSALVALITLTLIYAVGAMLWFRNQEKAVVPKTLIAAQLNLLGPLKSREWAALAGLGFVVVSIVTSSIHRIQPPWLVLTVLLTLLVFGTLRKNEFNQQVDWTFLLYLSGVTGIVSAFNHLGLAKSLGSALSGVAVLLQGNFEVFVLLLFVLIALIRLAVPINATIVILAAVLMPLAELSGVNPWVVGFIILMFAEMWFLPYQCSYYLQLRALNQARSIYDEGGFLRFNATMNLARLVAVYLSIPFWHTLGLQ
jgi:DASS family divalent anion:Na+ symporter